MTATPLDPFRDQTVSNIFARRDFRDAQSASTAAFASMLSAVDALCRRKFATGKKMDERELASLARSFSERVDSSLQPLWSFDSNRAATRTRPKGEAFERLRVHAAPLEDPSVAWIWASRLFADRKTAVFESFRLPFSWTRHAAGRVYQRSDQETEANRSIAETLTFSSLLLTIACDIVQTGDLPSRVAVPCKNGLLMGEVHTIAHPDGKGVVHTYDRIGHQSRIGGPRTSSGLTNERDKTTPGWRAITYVGEHEMRDAQIEYAERWNGIVTSHRAACIDFAKLLLRAAAKLDPVSPESLIEILETSEDVGNQVRDLLLDRRLSREIGNDWTAIPAGTPESLLDCTMTVTP